MLVLAVIGVFSYRSTTRFVEDTGRAARSRKVIGELKELLSEAQDLVLGARGYVVTGNDDFLDPHRNASSVIMRQAAVLTDLLASDDAQRRRLETLKSLVAENLSLTGRAIDLRKKEGFEAASGFIQMGHGKRVMDQIRKVVAEMEAAENESLNQRDKLAQLRGRQTLLVVTLGSLIGLISVGVASVIIYRDLTRRRQAEAERDGFFTLSLDLMCVADPSGRFTRLNPAWEALGYTVEELTAMPYVEFVHPEDRAATLAETGKIVGGTKTTSFENRYRCKDGSYRWLLWKAAISSDGRHIFAAARDISDRKNAEQELRQQAQLLDFNNTQLEAANKELEAFSYSVSHDLRAPLRGIDGFSQALLEDYSDKLDEEGKNNLNRVRAASQRMGHLIDDMLNLSRVTRVEFRREQVDLQTVANLVVAELRKAQPGREVEFVVADGLVAEVDARLLRIVLDNLLGNAWKFTVKQAKPRVEFGCTDDDGNRTYFVRDNGCGFDMTFSGKLFGAFQRLHAMSEFPGTGIGLATVQRVIRRHGGRVWAEAAPGKGATFFFTLCPATVAGSGQARFDPTPAGNRADGR